MDQQVEIELQTIIDDEGQMEYHTVRETGRCFQKGNRTVLTFEEKIENEAIKNLITIQPERVSIKRSGIVVMNQQFQLKRKTENIFQHPHGNIHMETFTHTIDYDQPAPDKHQGLLQMTYTVQLNGQENREHKLTLRFEPSH